MHILICITLKISSNNSIVHVGNMCVCHALPQCDSYSYGVMSACKLFSNIWSHAWNYVFVYVCSVCIMQHADIGWFIQHNGVTSVQICLSW